MSALNSLTSLGSDILGYTVKTAIIGEKTWEEYMASATANADDFVKLVMILLPLAVTLRIFGDIAFSRTEKIKWQKDFMTLVLGMLFLAFYKPVISTVNYMFTVCYDVMHVKQKINAFTTAGRDATEKILNVTKEAAASVSDTTTDPQQPQQEQVIVFAPDENGNMVQQSPPNAPAGEKDYLNSLITNPSPVARFFIEVVMIFVSFFPMIIMTSTTSALGLSMWLLVSLAPLSILFVLNQTVGKKFLQKVSVAYICMLMCPIIWSFLISAGTALYNTALQEITLPALFAMVTFNLGLGGLIATTPMMLYRFIGGRGVANII